jgi:anti-sigma-K factor RskA
MTQDTHDLVAAYALDSLDEEERERFQRHLAECEDCTEQLALLEDAATALAYGAEGPEPSPSLRGRILAAAAAEAQPEPQASVIRFPRRNWGLTAVAGVAAVAAVAALALGLWANSLSNSLDRERSANDVYEQTAQLLGANATTTPLVGADGSLLVADDGRAALVVCGLDRAPSEKTYEAWVISGTTPTPAGLFQGGGGCQPVTLTRSVPSGATVGVTIEQAGGATSPTLPIVFRAQPA